MTAVRALKAAAQWSHKSEAIRAQSKLHMSPQERDSEAGLLSAEGVHLSIELSPTILSTALPFLFAAVSLCFSLCLSDHSWQKCMDGCACAILTDHWSADIKANGVPDQVGRFARGERRMKGRCEVWNGKELVLHSLGDFSEQ
jgi:hypothetical protein